MAAPTNVYVDPAIAADSGTGTIGDPYGDVQYALNTQARDTTNGDQFNIKAGTDEILAAALTLATYGTPTGAAPLIFRGYTSAANDGGIGGMSGNGSVSVFLSTTLDVITFADLHCHNSGAATILQGDSGIRIINCEINNTSGAGVVIGSNGVVVRCHIHNCGAIGITVAQNSLVAFNFLKNGTNDFTSAISMSAGSIAFGNIVSLDGASNGITFLSTDEWTINNSFYSNGGTGTGISISNASRDSLIVLNNIVEGFSGSGGKGINLVAGATLSLYGNNKYYNNATHENLTGDVYNNLGNNSTLGASPFASPSTDNFMVDTTVKAGAYPTSFKGSITNQFLDVGAAQREEAGSGGGLLVHPGMGGGVRG